MPENQLKTRGVSYAEFLRGMAENANAGTAVLDSRAALSLVKRGIARRFPAMLFFWAAIALVIAPVALHSFFFWVTFPICLFLAYLSYKAARIFIMRSAWKALLGGQPAERMEQIYDSLVRHDLLWAAHWDNERR